jgi:23S rRNA (cytosine1962-C5)-methyltransferase
VVALKPGPGDPPRILPVVDARGIPLGTALFSPASQIQLRLISRELLSEATWMQIFEQRLQVALDRRNPLLDETNNACRLVFSEADELPGLVIDKYAGILIVQLLCRGLDTLPVREACVRVLKSAFSSTKTPITIWERQDPRIRELEGLTVPSSEPLFATKPKTPLSTTLFRVNGLELHFDTNAGQKTGAFLDQRQNYLAAAGWASRLGATGKALDVCTYQGGFALHLARVCSHVTGVDASHTSLEVAEKNLEQNRKQIPAEVDWIEADAFLLLRDLSDAATTPDWDVIVLDPPAFAKSKRAAEGALRGYKELNLRALKMIRPGGLLITCSCSHHVSLQDLEAAVAAAAADTNRRVTLLERRGASLDHPVVFNLAESEYLKCLILQVD